MKLLRIITINALLISVAQFASAPSSSTQIPLALSTNQFLRQDIPAKDLEEIEEQVQVIKLNLLNQQAQAEGFTSLQAKQEHEKNMRDQQQAAYFKMLENESTVENLCRMEHFHRQARFSSIEKENPQKYLWQEQNNPYDMLPKYNPEQCLEIEARRIAFAQYREKKTALARISAEVKTMEKKGINITTQDIATALQTKK